MEGGTESTANDLWLPGGKTSGKRTESVVAPIKWTDDLDSRLIKIQINESNTIK